MGVQPLVEAVSLERPMSTRKKLGQFFTPANVAARLVAWAARSPEASLLDPACGDGEFLAFFPSGVGIEIDGAHARTARARAPRCTVVQADFFDWARASAQRFDAVVGNPPFIRYQGFAGAQRANALALAERAGASFSALASSWAPFVAIASGLLKPGGRAAFVVPAEIGHASYARPLIEALCARFARVAIVAPRARLFPQLAEDAWLLFADGFGGACEALRFGGVEHAADAFAHDELATVPLERWRRAHGRLRRWLLSEPQRAAYEHYEADAGCYRFADVASVGIGYVSGDNEFFHLRPSRAAELGIPRALLRPAVRRGGSLPASGVLTDADVARWIAADEPVLLLALGKETKLPEPVARYLRTARARSARSAYKCAVREPWYAVPDVSVPDGFFTYMAGDRARLVRNAAGCVATNSVHVVKMKADRDLATLLGDFGSALTTLSCEIEGHAMGGGMLKIEPREAQRLLIAGRRRHAELAANALLADAVDTLRRWRLGPRAAQREPAPASLAAAS